MATTKGQPRRLAADERREVILRAARRLFARDGYAGTRLADIAAAARVTKPIVYRHFDSKKALYLALLAKHRDDLPTFFDRLDGAAPASPEAAARTVLEHWLDYVRENQDSWLLLFRDTSGDAEIKAFRRRVNRRAREVIAAFIVEQAGTRIPPKQVEPTAELLTSGLAGLVLWWIDHPDTPKDVLVEVSTRVSAAAVGSSG
jgi:AcrR family transcriptional regulator